MKNLGIIFLLLLTILNVSCEDLFDNKFSEKELSIVEECKSNLINDTDELKKNLIGEWKLIAISCDGCMEESSNLEQTFIFELDSSGKSISFGDEFDMKWDVVKKSDGSLQIITEPGNSLEDLNSFCARFMLYEGFGALLIYEKK